MEQDIYKLLEDKEFVKKIIVMQTPEEIQKAFLDRGVKISIKELEGISKSLSDMLNNNTNKKNITDNIENVSGGNISFSKAAKILKNTCITIGVGYVAFKGGELLGTVSGFINKANDTLDHVNDAIDGASGAVEDVRNEIIPKAGGLIQEVTPAVQGARSGLLGRLFLGGSRNKSNKDGKK